VGLLPFPFERAADFAFTFRDSGTLIFSLQ